MITLLSVADIYLNIWAGLGKARLKRGACKYCCDPVSLRISILLKIKTVWLPNPMKQCLQLLWIFLKFKRGGNTIHLFEKIQLVGYQKGKNEDLELTASRILVQTRSKDKRIFPSYLPFFFFICVYFIVVISMHLIPYNHRNRARELNPLRWQRFQICWQLVSSVSVLSLLGGSSGQRCSYSKKMQLQ